MLHWELNSRPQCIFFLILQVKFLETIFYAQQLYFLTLCIIHLASTFILLWNGSYIGQQARWFWKHVLWAGNAEKNLRSFTFLREVWRLSESETHDIRSLSVSQKEFWKNRTLQYVSVSYIQWPFHTIFCLFSYIWLHEWKLLSFILFQWKTLRDRANIKHQVI